MNEALLVENVSKGNFSIMALSEKEILKQEL